MRLDGPPFPVVEGHVGYALNGHADGVGGGGVLDRDGFDVRGGRPQTFDLVE